MFDFTLISLSRKELVLKFGKGTFVMYRGTVTEADKRTSSPIALDLMPASKQQLCKKWYLKRKEIPGKTQEQLERLTRYCRGSFFDIQENEKYLVRMSTTQERGQWTFGDQNTSIIFGKGNRKRAWLIYKISDTELVLTKGGSSPEKWFFSTSK